ncbi:hypothetical protein ACHAWF_012531 [Thalassiosira exigua]
MNNQNMRTLTPRRTAVASFASASPPPPASSPALPSASSSSAAASSGFEYDAGEYVLSVASPSSSSSASGSSSSSVVAAALSDRSLVVHDFEANRVVRRIEGAHDGPISEVSFLPRESGSSLLSAGRDGAVKVWDLRSSSQNNPVAKMQLAHPGEEALTFSLGYGGTLCAVGTSEGRVPFFDLRRAGGGDFGGALMGSYVDAHTEEVTKVRFQSIPPSRGSSDPRTVLATASEDGLVNVYDPSKPSEDEALLSVMNVGAPLRDAGFFGPNMEGLYCLTGNETMSVHHWDSAQRVSDCGGDGLRDALSQAVDSSNGKDGGKGNNGSNGDAMDEDEGKAVEYLVGCSWASTPLSGDAPALHLLAGNARGDAYLFRVDADAIAPLARSKGGHRGCVRDFCWLDDDDDGGGGVARRRLVTGGEDARLCEWDLGGDEGATGGAPSGRATRGRDGGGGPLRSGRSAAKGGAGDDPKKKGRKKFGSPY